MTITITGSGINYPDGTQTTAFRSSNATSGWARLADGTLVQWGQTATYTINGNGVSRAAQTVTFPVAFSSIYQIVLGNNMVTMPGGALWYPILGSANSITTSGFTWWCGEPNNGCYGGTLSAVWIAFGN